MKHLVMKHLPSFLKQPNGLTMTAIDSLLVVYAIYFLEMYLFVCFIV